MGSSQVQMSFHVPPPHFLFVGKRLQPPRPPLRSKRQIQTDTHKRQGMQKQRRSSQDTIVMGCPGGAVVKNPPANAGDTGSSPGLGESHMPQSS